MIPLENPRPSSRPGTSLYRQSVKRHPKTRRMLPGMDIDTEEEILSEIDGLEAAGIHLASAEIETRYIDKNDPDWRASYAASRYAIRVLDERRHKSGVTGFSLNHTPADHEGPQYRARIADAAPHIRAAVLEGTEYAALVHELAMAALADYEIDLSGLDTAAREQWIAEAEAEVLGSVQGAILHAARCRMGGAIFVHPIFL